MCYLPNPFSGLNPQPRNNAKLLRDKLRKADQAVPFPVGQVDRVIGDFPRNQALRSTDDAVDAVVNIGKIEDLIGSKDRHELAFRQLADKERHDPLHALEIAVEAAIDVGETEDEVR